MSNEFDDLVILVDEGDSEIGTAGKMAVHYSGQLHRAFSVFIFTTDGRLLLQQRALNKYHSGGRWTNTCCSHPRPGEETFAAANRRLQEEMGLTSSLVYMFNFTYRAAIEGQLIEHEFDHVYFGISDSQPSPNPEEASAYRYTTLNDLAMDLQEHPEQYTEWLKICFERLVEAYGKVFNFNKQGVNTVGL